MYIDKLFPWHHLICSSKGFEIYILTLLNFKALRIHHYIIIVLFETLNCKGQPSDVVSQININASSIGIIIVFIISTQSSKFIEI